LRNVIRNGQKVLVPWNGVTQYFTVNGVYDDPQ
jgi:hypothetical protein